jgi:hypothetical protein
MTLDIDDSHADMVLRPSTGESPPQEWPLGARTMLPVSLSSRRRQRKARKVARLLVALDDVSKERRPVTTRRARASLGLSRAA